MVDISRLVVFLLALSLGTCPLTAWGSLPATGQPPGQPVQVQSVDYSPLKKQMESFIRGKKSDFAIYFEDLASGASFGINADKPMVAASTVKLPMAL
ncbi:MAG: serine hydrolase, partial [Desulfofundulus sp.]